MNLTNAIAIRYLFGRKSSQAIHWITGISVLGISVGSAALILVLSVFNGFEELLSGLFSKYNPDIKIVLKEGKTFREDSLQMQSLHTLNGVLYVTRTLEEVAMFQYDDAHEFGIIKGVDSEFEKVCAAREAVVEGNFEITSDGAPLANLGLGIKNKLGVSISNFQEVIKVFVPDHEENLNFTNEIKRYPLQPQSVFSFHQDGDYSNIITDLNAVQIILKKPNQLSSIELKLNPGTSVQNILPEIRRIMGDSYLVKDRYQQDEAFLKIMKLEKWLFYSLFCLTLLLVSFTVVGALWMIVLEKRMDISILKSMGMTDRNMKMVFVHLGLMICFLGLMFGSALALTFYWLQKKYGLIGVPEEFIIDSYPIQIRLADFLVVGLTVLLIGCIASFLPTRKVAEILPVFHEE